MSFTVIIPARFQSSRLPGKPLMDIHGYPMIQWTWLQAKKSGAERIIITTESKQVEQACLAFGAEVCLTSDHHQSGTERIAEVIDLLQLDDNEVIVNVQGDEPMLPPELIHQVAQGLANQLNDRGVVAHMATLCEPIEDIDTVFDAHAVKVTRDAHNYAINFSRAALPWARDEFALTDRQMPSNWHYKRHIGLYAYTAGFVKQYVAWPACDLEQVEKLEQLRVLWHGEKILVLDALMDAGIGVDTESDLIKVRQKLSAENFK
ncbi:3-deoxy-manno-octulosonate cytidylyltransferase [Thiomicrorhabdus sediminis]|uniref:3-deoxy-manno-octulosonate cytidylyltransferase n=1 Tax=Thiomicrorhabdus sediminis TaxID=2580412 RepID=A0A4P9K659_9GAMM|nr:3-deoxy-manno-octulosonate cytidylyltransferase [Thiomicrorhabdus sediminis]QCU90348.1 3-deoxy-manno-octulosonate cytidylyltransferase [Thiomicrorhabdus sediminis]